jgi:peptidoglycan hydrolase-like protein with peptidoglycan-binding domain
VLTNKLLLQPSRAANYGWHVASSSYPATVPGLFVLQPLGLAHNRFHVDYSQTVRLVRATCRVDGVERALVDVLSDPALAPLICHEGVLQVFRQPGVPTDAPVPPSPITRVLKRGASGSDVALWQTTIGVLPADGIFGPMTEAATKAWQTAHGLVADGIVGPLTRAAAGL